MKILVLGANGLVGSNLVNALVQEGLSVRAFDRYSRKPTFNPSELVEIFPGDFFSSESIERALEGVSKVVITTAASSPAASENDPLLDIEQTLIPTVRVLDLCAKGNVEDVYFCSSGGAIYGELAEGQVSSSETDTAVPVSPYGISKLAVEGYLRYFSRKYGLNSVIFRISNVFGTPLRFIRGQGLIPAVLINASTGQTISRMGDGSSLRDYIYAKDLAIMMTQIIAGRPKSGIYNLGSGTARDINSVIKTVSTVSNSPIIVQEIPSPLTFLSRQVLNIDRFISEFGKPNFTPFEDAISRLWNEINLSD